MDGISQMRSRPNLIHKVILFQLKTQLWRLGNSDPGLETPNPLSLIPNSQSLIPNPTFGKANKVGGW